ncbi:MAG: hypothetical protein QG556_985 [Pseudomonadota bacterium]|nr:hypothetical protein [Pseudomonadota bacterium]
MEEIMKMLACTLALFAVLGASPVLACETVNKAGATVSTALWSTGVGVTNIGVGTYSTIVHGAMKTTTGILGC